MYGVGAPAVEGVESGHDKGRRLAKWIGDKRAALILDGLEPLQYAPTSPLAGQLKDDGLRALLKGLAQHSNGLCLVTTRYAIKDLEGYRATAPQRDLAPLTKEAGARLLEALGVKGTRQERRQLSEDVWPSYVVRQPGSVRYRRHRTTARTMNPSTKLRTGSCS
jgi:hypothetical protein